jgi:hypothetical protein
MSNKSKQKTNIMSISNQEAEQFGIFQQGPIANEPQPSFGMKLVGYQFNPSGNEKVNRIKYLSALIADVVYNQWCNGNTSDPIENEIFHHAIGEILNAQMSAVKLITFRPE